MPWLPVMHSAEEELAYFRGTVLREEKVFVAQAQPNHPIIGFVSFKEPWLNHLYVDPAHFRTGVGTALLTFVQLKSGALNLWTFQKNTGARAFYASHGFEEVELTDGQANEERTPDVRMAWRPEGAR